LKPATLRRRRSTYSDRGLGRFVSRTVQIPRQSVESARAFWIVDPPIVLRLHPELYEAMRPPSYSRNSVPPPVSDPSRTAGAAPEAPDTSPRTLQGSRRVSSTVDPACAMSRDGQAKARGSCARIRPQNARRYHPTALKSLALSRPPRGQRSAARRNSAMRSAFGKWYKRRRFTDARSRYPPVSGPVAGSSSVA